MSPQANTPGTEVAEGPVDRDVAPGVEVEAELGHAAVDLRAEKAHGEQDEVGFELKG